MKRFIPFDPDQPLLLPPDLRTALPEGHPALLVSDVVEQLDLGEVYAGLEDERYGGRPGFDPRMMVRVWIYAYLLGMRSSRRLARALVESIPFRVLAGNQTPQYWALNRFRTRHRQALGNLLSQTVEIAAGMGLVKLASVAIDGTKIKANASKHKALSYGRIDAAEERLKGDIDAFLDACDEVDQEENARLGSEDDGVSLPLELRDAQARRNKIAAAKKQLEERARERLEAEQEKRRLAAAAKGRVYHPRKELGDAEPEASEQVNFTDPESRIMLSGDAFVQGYNAQAAVDTESLVVVAAALSNQAADAPHLPSLVIETMKNTGETPERWRAQQAPKGRIPKDLSRKDRMRRRLATKQGKRLYLQRQASVEPVFGNLKDARGLRQFLHRGLEKNHHRFRFDMAVHNVSKIIRRLQSALASSAPRKKRRNRAANPAITSA